jgi:hypothetical protein
MPAPGSFDAAANARLEIPKIALKPKSTHI